MEIALESIESASFLTAEQRRDILFNNAARFLRLSRERIAEMHGGQR
jgi:predicted TIM-barrel fold metal-dependent hydrolase